MRLLVSVRSADEVAAAIAGGADIIDVKEPARGSLGAVDEATMRAIAQTIPDEAALSVALGDLSEPGEVTRALVGIDGVMRRLRGLYVKVGLAGVGDVGVARRAVEAIAEVVGTTRLQPDLVLVAYADHERAKSLDRDAVTALAAGAGCHGVLLDTWIKDGRDLFDWVERVELRGWLERSRQRGLVTAVAGSLAGPSFGRAASLGPDILGVRGAACDGGRNGVVSQARVRTLAAALAVARSRRGAAA
jgi:hypothetical protein